MQWKFNYEESFKKAMNFIVGKGALPDFRDSGASVKDIVNTIALNHKGDENFEYNAVLDFITLANDCTEALGGILQIEDDGFFSVTMCVEKLYIEKNIKCNPTKPFLEKAIKVCKYIDVSAKNEKVMLRFDIC